MATLHTVNKSPFEKRSLESCLRIMRRGSTMLLIEDGVYAALAGTAVQARVEAAMPEASVYCLAPDLSARGFSAEDCIAGVELIDYEGFVDLAVAHDNVQAWL